MESPQRDNSCGADTNLIHETLWKGEILQSDTRTRGLEELPGCAAKHWSSFFFKVGFGRRKVLRQESKVSF